MIVLAISWTVGLIGMYRDEQGKSRNYSYKANPDMIMCAGAYESNANPNESDLSPRELN